MKHFPAIPAGRVESAIATIAFMLLFPGFFFYHTLLGTGMMGAFLGGYYGPVSVLLTLPLSLVYAYQLKRDPRRLAMIDLYFGVFLVYFFMVVVVNGIAGANPAIVSKHLLEITFWTNLFIIFKTIDFTGKYFRLAAIASLLAMSAIVFMFQQDGAFYLGAMGMSQNEDALATYQGFSRSYQFAYMAVIAFTPALSLRVVLYALAAATLFLNTARSEFVAALFVIPIIELYYSRQKLIFVLVFALIVALIAINFDDIVSSLPHNRILELLDLSQSTSANKRHYLSVYAMQSIAASPIFGDYASYPPGLYSHNILSAWVDVGLFGMVYLMAMLILPAAWMFFKEYFSRKPNSYFLLAFSMACVTVMLLIESHYFTDTLIGATFGAFSKYSYQRRYGGRRAAAARPAAPRAPALRPVMAPPIPLPSPAEAFHGHP